MGLRIPQATVRPKRPNPAETATTQLHCSPFPRQACAPKFQTLIAQVPDTHTYQTRRFRNLSLAALQPSSKAFLAELASSQEHQAQKSPRYKSPRYAPVLPPAATSSLPCRPNLRFLLQISTLLHSYSQLHADFAEVALPLGFVQSDLLHAKLPVCKTLPASLAPAAVEQLVPLLPAGSEHLEKGGAGKSPWLTFFGEKKQAGDTGMANIPPVCSEHRRRHCFQRRLVLVWFPI